jgi:2-haloacid dehalogenase
VLLFDVFGTCVDWRTGISLEGETLGEELGIVGIDWAELADAWRERYQPKMEEVRSGRRPWTTLDALHRESLDDVLRQFGLDEMPAAERDTFTLAWHRLDPWPDVVAGLTRLKTRFVIAPNSNGNIALLLDMAKRAGLPWDAILGAEIAHAYKPQPEVYRMSAAAAGAAPAETMMVAAHNDDLVAAAACGLMTAFVPRPLEYGLGQTSDLFPEHAFDLVARDFGDLAAQLGA